MNQNLLTDEGRAELARTIMRPISPEVVRGEDSWTTSVRQTAERLLSITRSQRWSAMVSEPLYHVNYADLRFAEIYTFDLGRLVVHVTSLRPVARMYRHRISIAGEYIPHRAVVDGLPHGPSAVAESVWRHLNDIGHAACDVLACRAQPTVAVPNGGYCADHIGRYEH